jgi:hypothetical protein
MELSFYKNLNPTQKAFADRIAAKAKEMGIPPELAVSVAFQESGLNPKVANGSAGEIGIMQIKPTTAKEMGFSLEDLSDPMKNIEAGLSYLKKSYDLSEGNPKLAAAGYNAGVNHPFFSSKDQALPDTTVKYLKNLNTFGAFVGAPEKKQVDFQEPPMSAETANIQQEIDKVDEGIARGRGQLVGGALGAGETLRRGIIPAIKGVSQAAQEGRIAADAKMGASPRVPPTPVGGAIAPNLAAESTAMNRILQGTTDDLGTTGRARMQGFNVETAQQAARAKEAARNVGALQRQGLVAQGAPDVLARSPGMTSTPSGIVYPRTPPAAKMPPAVPKSGLDEVTQIFRKMIEPGSKLRTAGGVAMKYGAPPLALMQAGSETGSMISEGRKEQPDYMKMGLSGLGALGAGMSMFPATAPVGIPLAVTAPLIQYLRETKSERPEGQLSDITAP